MWQACHSFQANHRGVERILAFLCTPPVWGQGDFQCRMTQQCLTKHKVWPEHREKQRQGQILCICFHPPEGKTMQEHPDKSEASKHEPHTQWEQAIPSPRSARCDAYMQGILDACSAGKFWFGPTGLRLLRITAQPYPSHSPTATGTEHSRERLMAKKSVWRHSLGSFSDSCSSLGQFPSYISVTTAALAPP